MAQLEWVQKRKHVPQRTCVVCREKTHKNTLTRIVRTEIGIRVDTTGKLNGRGAYLCNKYSCWKKAVDGGILNNALRQKLTEADREHLRTAMPEPEP